MNNIPQSEINLLDVTEDNLSELAHNISRRQTNHQFMRFLKETPMTVKQNVAILEKELSTPHCVCKWIRINGIQDIVWLILFHCFNADKKELEIGFRIDPLLQQKWICTQAVKASIAHVFSQNKIENIVGRHSAWNAGSFGVFRKSWFELADFVTNQTFLPNIGKLTDDFKWRIRQDMLTHNTHDVLDITNEKRMIIKDGLLKHQFQLPNPLFFHQSQTWTP